MGASNSIENMPCKNEARIHESITKFYRIWRSEVGGLQTELFNAVMNTDVSNMDSFNEVGLDKVFTNRDKCYPEIKFGDFNCTHLFRTSQESGHSIPILSNGKYIVIHPLGEPGRDLGEGCGTRISHLMVVKHCPMSDSEPYTFNECLPTSKEETDDFLARISFLENAVLNLKNNVAIKYCGDHVIKKAKEFGLTENSSIREYMTKAIVRLPEEIRLGGPNGGKGPGYKMLDHEGNDVCKDPVAVSSLINEVFSDKAYKTLTVIQPPDWNSQILSHIHTFLVNDEVPDSMFESYYDCHTILKIKSDIERDGFSEEEGETEDMGGGLARQDSRMG